MLRCRDLAKSGADVAAAPSVRRVASMLVVVCAVPCLSDWRRRQTRTRLDRYVMGVEAQSLRTVLFEREVWRRAYAQY